MSQIMTVAQSRLVALQHDETQRTPMVGTKHLIAKDNACVFENSPEVAEEKSTHCHKKVIEMQRDKCQELGLLETNTFLAITAVLQDNEKDILVSKYNKHTLVAKQSLASLVLLELATMTLTKCPLSFTLCLQCRWGTSQTNNQIVPIYSSARVHLKIEICKHGSLCHVSHDANEMMGNYGVIDETKLQSRFLKEFASLSLQPKNFHGWDSRVSYGSRNLKL